MKQMKKIPSRSIDLHRNVLKAQELNEEQTEIVSFFLLFLV